MNRFWGYLGGTVARPYLTFRSLQADPRQTAYGILALLLIGILYTLTVAGLAGVGADISTATFVNIPPERYYFWEIFFALPVFVLGCVLGAGIVQLLSRAFGGAGNFEGTFAALAFAMAVPSFVTWIPETVGTGLMLSGVLTQAEWLEMVSRSGFWQVFGAVYQFAALAWYAVLIPVAVASSQKMNCWRSIIVGIVTLAVVGFVMFVFIR